MANTNTVTDYEDPFQLADLAKREGPEGLLRLADYFETTGQQTPLTVKTALAMSRGPGVFPINGASTSAPTPRVPRTVPGEMEYFEAHPTAEMRASGELYDQKTGQLLAKNISDAMLQDRYPPEDLRRSDVLDYDPPVTRPTKNRDPAAPITRPAPARRAAPSPEAQGPVPSFTLEDVPSGPIPSFTQEDVPSGPIPVANASTRTDAPTAVASTLPSAGPQAPAGKPNSDGAPNLPAPSSEGAGGDTSERDLYLARLAAQNAAGFGGMGAGKNIDMGIADTLGERLRQVQALRAKREEKEVTDAQEVANNKAQVDYLISRFPEQTDSLTKLYGMTRKANFPQFVRLEEQIALDRARAKTEGVKPEVALRGAAVKEAGQVEKEAEGESKRLKREQDAAVAWLRANAATKPAAEERGIKPQDLTARLEKLNVVTKPYQEMVSSLREADAALSDLSGAAPTGLERVAGAIPGGERLLRPETLRAKRAQEGLKESYQKLKTGLAAVGQELTSFERRFGLNWFADPRSAPLAIESLKEITREALRSAQAPYGGGTGNPAVDQLEVLSLAKKTGSLTSDSPVFAPNPKLREAAGMKPAEAPAVKSSATSTPAGGVERVIMLNPQGERRAVRADQVEKAMGQGWRMP